jgi:hypothetical protein
MVTFTASVFPAQAAQTATFYIGTQAMGTANVVGGVATLSVPLLESVDKQLIPGSRTVTAGFGGVSANFTVGIPTATLEITREDARAEYTGATFVWTSSATSSTATVTLSATIKDITALSTDSAYDPDGGDITKATVKFVNRDAGNAVLCTASGVGLVNAGNKKIGTATCNWSANIGSADSLPYTIGILVEGYYTRNSSQDNEVVTISKPLTSSFHHWWWPADQLGFIRYEGRGDWAEDELRLQREIYEDRHEPARQPQHDRSERWTGLPDQGYVDDIVIGEYRRWRHRGSAFERMPERRCDGSKAVRCDICW